MEEIKEVHNYIKFKQQLDNELSKTAESFVKIGYYLKVARDTNVLKDSGYKTVAEFAAKEYGLTKDIVSRYIRINDKFSKNNYSEELEDTYKQFGYSKLADMLTLPNDLVELIPAETPRVEIQKIVKEVKEEEKVTDLEVAMEEKSQFVEHLDSNLKKVLFQYFSDKKDKLNKILATYQNNSSSEIEIINSIMNELASSGSAVIIERIKGLGKFLLTIKGKDIDSTLINVRSDEKEQISWKRFVDEIYTLYQGASCWEDCYHEEKKEIVQEEQKPSTEEKEIKVSEHQEIKQDEKKQEVAPVQPKEEEEQLPGQANITDYPEYMPKEQEQQPTDEVTVECEVVDDIDVEEVEKKSSDILFNLNRSMHAKDWDAATNEIEELRKNVDRLRGVQHAKM